MARGQKFMCCVRNPRNINIFVRPGTRPGGRIGDRGHREIVYVPNVFVPFPGPTFYGDGGGSRTVNFVLGWGKSSKKRFHRIESLMHEQGEGPKAAGRVQNADFFRRFNSVPQKLRVF